LAEALTAPPDRTAGEPSWRDRNPVLLNMVVTG